MAAVALVAVLPCGLVALANAAFILDLFFARPPFLLDAGWFTAIVHRSGWLLHNPSATRHYGTSFYAVHVSPFMSLFSVLSYLVPLDRFAWYALFQGVVYAPLALAPYLVSSRAAPTSPWRMPLTAFMAITFAFSGQSIIAIQYPHFEVAIASFTCLLLAAIVTDRRPLIWPLLVLAVSVREDAGFHVACALCPLLYLNRTGQDAALRRRLVALIAAAAGACVLAFAVQKLVFPTPTTAWRMPFFGAPLFHQLKEHGLRERLSWLVHGCPYITAPFVLTALLAAVRRDARYLLGWLAVTPWLIANLLAYEDGKWRLLAYVGFPCLVSLFWVYLYGALLAPRPRRLGMWSLDLVFAGMCLGSLGALYIQYPALVQSVARAVSRRAPAHPREVRAYASAIHARPELGRFCVDPAVAALAVREIARGQGCDPGTRDTDTFAFHRDGGFDANLLVDLSANGITRCTHVLETGYFLCSKLDQAPAALAALRTEQLPPLLAFANVDTGGRRVSFEPGGVAIAAGSAPGLVIASRPLATHAEGRYEIVWDVVVEDSHAVGAAAAVEVVVDDVVVAKARASNDEPGDQQLVLPFTVRANQWFAARLRYEGPGTLKIAGASVRAKTPNAEP